MLQLSTTTWKHWQRLLSFLHDRTNSFKKRYSTTHLYVEKPIVMISNSAFTGSFAENPFGYQQLNLGDIRILRGGKVIVHQDTTDNCRLYVTTMKAMNFQDDIPSIPAENFKDHYVLMLDLTSMQDANEQCHYTELIGQPLRLELYFSSPLENVTEIIVLGERMSYVAVDKFGVVGKNL